MPRFLFAAAITTVAAFGACSPVFAQDDADQKFGKVHFATTCNEVAQRRFDRGMRYQHSFWYAESKEIYQEAKGNGFDVKVLREVIRLRKQDQKERDEQESLLDAYRQAIKGASRAAKAA